MVSGRLRCSRVHDIGNSMTSVSVYTFTVVPCSLCMGCEGKQFERLRQGS